MTTPAARYRENHPDRVAKSQESIEAKTIKRASVRFLKGRDDDLMAWLNATYGGSGGPEILEALGDLRKMDQVFYLTDSSYEGDTIFEDLFFANYFLAAAELEVIFNDNKYENWAGYELKHREDGQPYIFSEHRTIEIVEADLITD